MKPILHIIFVTLLANTLSASNFGQLELALFPEVDRVEISDSCVCLPGGGTSGLNLVTNGDFAQGNLGFNSGLPLLAQQNCSAQSYWVGQNLRDKCSLWDQTVIGRPDGISGTTNFLIVDGDPFNAQNIWNQSVIVVPGMTYQFSFWTVSVYSPVQQNINLEVVIRDNSAGTVVMSPILVSQTAGLPWVNHWFSWTCPANFSVGPQMLEINQTAGSDFTDFGIDDICFTKIDPQDSCCTTLEDFCHRIENAVTITVNSDSCKATVNVGNLADCDYIEYIDWGSQIAQGPFNAGDMPMYIYPGSGSYEICYLAIELDTEGFICFEKLVCDTINLMCTPCCTDSLGFFNAAANVETFGTLGDCMIHFNATGLDSCMQISYVWGDSPSQVEGPYGNNTAVWHTYAGPGTYSVCYFIDEVDEDGEVCWTYEHCEEVLVLCDSCHCGELTDLYIRTGGAPSQSVVCGGDPVQLACPQPGNSIALTGLFQCIGNECPEQVPVAWTLSNATNSWSGTSSGPFFTITLLPTYFTQAGLYTLTIIGQCGVDECPCVIQFIVDCPDLCPCEPDDLQAFSDAVDRGFAQMLFPASCKACFSPLALSDCETVEWYIGNITSPPAGTSIGNQSYCHQFNAAGTYNVIMVVTRLRPDGSICEVFTKSQLVNVRCLPAVACDNPGFPNPGFIEGAIPGSLNMGGTSSGWAALEGAPEVVEGLPGSNDGWTIRLLANYDSTDVLTSLEPICLEKGTGMVSIHTWGDPHENISGLKWNLKVSFFQGNDFSRIDCVDDNCHELASVDLSPLDAEWAELQLPFDLTNWSAFDSCGGVLVRPAIYLESHVGIAVTGSVVNPTARRIVQLDNFCFNGTLVAASNPVNSQVIHVYPNPTAGDISLHFDAGSPVACQVQIIDLWGRTLIFENLAPGLKDHSLSLSTLPSGVYFAKVTQNRVPVWMEKVIVQY